MASSASIVATAMNMENAQMSCGVGGGGGGGVLKSVSYHYVKGFCTSICLTL